MKPQFRLRTLLIVTAFVALLVAWWVDRTQLQSRIDELEAQQQWWETDDVADLIGDGVQFGDSIPLESESELEN